MKIAISAADLDHKRIDGTRVYIFNLLKQFGKLDLKSEFLIYHKSEFNPELEPPVFPNFHVTKISFPWLWTQARFAYELWKSQADVVWMPMAALPMLRRKKTKTVITIHDLAFKRFPETFTKGDLRKLNFFADYSIRHADKIIAISEATKKDILHFYPEVRADKIRVIYHGFSAEVFAEKRDIVREEELKKCWGIQGEYILYSGALQPRKNIVRLIEAFGAYKKRTHSQVKLVLAGEKAWLAEGIEVAAQKSPFTKDIIILGRVKFCDIGHLFRGASVFVYPSLYEGFGITILEAYAAGVPLLTASNSSLPEVAGEAALYFDAEDVAQLSAQIEKILSSELLQAGMIAKGKERLQVFSWEKCARETLDYLTE
ncbi:MAG: glycosyltransferase family 1 protein [Parcubacteria group bacterium]|jgi:glycosyltransferase involved in cell wall biosynthesis